MTVTREELVTFLRQHSVAVLATVTATGAPEAAAIEFMVDDDLHIVFDTFVIYRKYVNLRREPRVALVIGWGEATVQYEGRADELAGDALAHYQRLYVAQLPNAGKFIEDPRTRWFRVRPTLVRYRNYAADAEMIEEWEP